MRDSVYYKLTGEELRKVVGESDARKIEEASKKRISNSHAKKIVKIYLNKTKTVWVQSIHYYGGEHFGEPYHFLAEVTHRTTECVFVRTMNNLNLRWVYHKIPFAY